MRSDKWTVLHFQGVPQLPKFLSSWPHHKQPTVTQKAMDTLRLWWALQRNWWKNQWRMENHGIMVWCNTELLLLVHPFHHHCRCWQEEDLIPPFHNFHQQLDTMWKPLRFEKNCLGGSPTLPREPHGIGPWTTCLCQGSEWKCLKNCYWWPASS